MSGVCVTPPPLTTGDTVAIVSPASVVDPTLVTGAAEALCKRGFNVLIGKHALGESGTYSGSRAERAADMNDALTNGDVRAILCSRGGYGAVQILDDVALQVDASNPKWLVGFSDISALHALWHHRGIASVHGSMARHLAMYAPDDAPNAALMHILGTSVGYDMTWDTDNRNRYGYCRGQLVGGNVAVLADLLATPYNLLQPGAILFIEDVSEPVYKVERIMWQLRLADILPRLGGLIVGQFTDCRANANHATMEDMIAEMTSPYSYPVAFGCPIGHFDGNMPLLESVEVTLAVETDRTQLRYI
ncbi:MAG: LD-carboxypeptidase [Muribaculaceae bacterium]|nr:LD-carboxypeptidase [Muribaculaceae bacterium]